MSSTQLTTFFKFSSALLFLSGEDNIGTSAIPVRRQSDDRLSYLPSSPSVYYPNQII